MQSQNDSDEPVANARKYEAGKLTYYVLGAKDPSIQVKIVTEGARRWSRGTQTIHDGTLPPGKSKVIDKGGSAASISTYRVVLKDGREVTLAACVVCKVREGKITRLDEYFDSAALAALAAHCVLLRRVIGRRSATGRLSRNA